MIDQCCEVCFSCFCFMAKILIESNQIVMEMEIIFNLMISLLKIEIEK